MGMADGTSIFTFIPPSTVSDSTSTEPPPVDPTPRPIRRRFATTGRVRSGCLTCKKRKKKCDYQQWPCDEWCQSCIRLGLVCEREPLRTVEPRQKKTKSNNDKDRQTRAVSGYESAGIGDAAKEEPRSISANTDDRRKSNAGNTDNSYNRDNTDDIFLSPGSPSVSWQLPPPRHSDGDDKNSVSFVNTPSSGFMALFALENASPERILLKYYIEHLAPLCSILQEGKNEFRNVLLPMAIDDSSLLYALFNYASIHVPSSGPIPSITPLMRLKFESQVARGLSEAIRLNSISESSVACSLICSTAEVISGDTKRWLVHLQGAGHLLNQLGGPEKLRQTSDGRFLMRNFAYHDIMAAFSTGSRPRFRGVYWLDDSSFIPADCLMGVAHQIIGRMSDICHFMADKRDCDPAVPVIAARVIREGEVLAQALRSQPVDICTSLSDTEQELLIYHAESYRFSALLHLYRFLSRVSADDTLYAIEMDQCVLNIMTKIDQIPFNHSCEVGLVFPLFMAGVACAGDDVKTSYIRRRLENIERWTNFQHVSRVRELLDMLWANCQTDWEALLLKLDWQVSLA